MVTTQWIRGFRLRRLHLCSRVRLLPNEYPVYDTKPSELPLLPGPLWPGVVFANKVPSMSQIEIFNHLQYLKTSNSVQVID